LSKQNDTPQTAYKPFDKNRDGLAISEGAGMIIMEPPRRVKSRNAHVYAYISGYATTTDGVDRIEPAADGKQLARAIRTALDDARMNPKDIDYVCLDGVGTKIGDVSETRAIKEVFNSHAKSIPMSAPKSIYGNMLGATGVVDVITTVLAIEHSVVPPTINLNDPDPECDLDYVPNNSRSHAINNAMIISRGRGGINSVLVIQKSE
jgi:3-oxoacyl-(acyl-carrier-protein) synthase